MAILFLSFDERGNARLTFQTRKIQTTHVEQRQQNIG